MGKNEVNLKCYEGVESVQLYDLSEEEQIAHMEDKLLSAESDVRFIQNSICKQLDHGINVCEIGSGNSKLLYLLEKKNLIEDWAVGYEVAETRFLFAEKIKELLGSTYVENRHRNFLEDEPCVGSDLVVFVDIVFQMIAPLCGGGAEAKALEWTYRSLKQGGYAFFEIEDFSYIMKEIESSGKNEYRKWEEFPETDPYEYGLYKLSKDEDGYLIYDKVFLRRDGAKKEKNHSVWKPYTRESFINLLNANGFSAKVYDYYNSEAEKQMDKDKGIFRNTLFRVLARKN